MGETRDRHLLPMNESTPKRHLLRVPDDAPRVEIRRAMAVMEWLERRFGYRNTEFFLARPQDVEE